MQAAAVPLTALTAWQALFDHANLTPGQSILIHGAAGGVGVFAVLPLSQAQQAYEQGAKGHTRGKFVLQVVKES